MINTADIIKYLTRRYWRKKNLRSEPDKTTDGTGAYGDGKCVRKSVFLTGTKYWELTIMLHLKNLNWDIWNIWIMPVLACIMPVIIVLRLM